MAKGYLLSEQAVRRTAETVRRVAQMPIDLRGKQRPRRTVLNDRCALLKITAVNPAAIGKYEAVPVRLKSDFTMTGHLADADFEESGSACIVLHTVEAGEQFTDGEDPAPVLAVGDLVAGFRFATVVHDETQQLVFVTSALVGDACDVEEE